MMRRVIYRNYDLKTIRNLIAKNSQGEPPSADKREHSNNYY